MITGTQRKAMREDADRNAKAAGISRMTALGSGRRTSREIFALNSITLQLEALRLEIRAGAER